MKKLKILIIVLSNMTSVDGQKKTYATQTKERLEALKPITKSSTLERLERFKPEKTSAEKFRERMEELGEIYEIESTIPVKKITFADFFKDKIIPILTQFEYNAGNTPTSQQIFELDTILHTTKIRLDPQDYDKYDKHKGHIQTILSFIDLLKVVIDDHLQNRSPQEKEKIEKELKKLKHTKDIKHASWLFKKLDATNKYFVALNHIYENKLNQSLEAEERSRITELSEIVKNAQRKLKKFSFDYLEYIPQ
jgi:hypothetical protein